MEHRFWSVQLTVYRTERPHNQALQNLRANLTPETTTLLPGETVSICLQKIQHKMRTICKEADTKCHEFLNTLQQAAKHTNNKQRQKLILGLKHAGENRQCFCIVKNFLKPTNGGVTHVMVPHPTEPTLWDTVHDIPQMEHHLLNQSRQHFQQAHGTPYTIEPLATLVENHGLSNFGESIFHREPIPADLPISKHARLLLQHQRSLLPPQAPTMKPLEFEPLMAGFWKWPEQTTTSPSGRHLGVYKSLLKDKHTEKPGEAPKPKGIDIMYDIFCLLVLAVQHTHTFDRWRTIWNMYLEKDPGMPKINHLRTLHLIEADLNLLWKSYSSKGFIPIAEQHKILHDSQGGSRAGRSAIDLACKKIATFDIIRIAQQIVAEISNDAANYFDRMIEASQNLSCHQHGADVNYLKLHAQMILLFRYHVKHAFGISTKYNTHTDKHPWYGAGQGAGDAAHQWVVLVNSLILAYLSQADPWNLTSPDRKITLTQGFDAFMDDTAMTIAATNHQRLADVVATAQNNLTLWNNLLQASGGILNPSKCVWFQFNWDL